VPTASSPPGRLVTFVPDDEQATNNVRQEVKKRNTALKLN